jgi:uncharacterized membrane-anchored protein
VVNNVALKLGRYGYEHIVLIADASNPQAGMEFAQAVGAHRFDDGDRYVDHAGGDRAAEYGVAGLVAGVLGVKLLKAGFLIGLLVALKKFVVALVLIPILAVRAAWNKFFGRKPKVAP